MNKIIVWQDSYSVGVPLLDFQHKALIALINRLSTEPSNSAIMGWVFDELNAYVKDHFKEEEKLLKKAGYPGYKNHKKEHKAFKQWLSAVRQSYSMGVTSPSLLSETVNEFLRDWLVKHILSSDMSYKEFFASDDSSAVDGGSKK